MAGGQVPLVDRESAPVIDFRRFEIAVTVLDPRQEVEAVGNEVRLAGWTAVVEGHRRAIGALRIGSSAASKEISQTIQHITLVRSSVRRPSQERLRAPENLLCLRR